MIRGTYRKNDKYEVIVIAFVSLLAISSILFSFYLSNQIQEQEKAQVLLWAKAISKKSNVLKISNDVFQKLRDEERKKVEITSKTTRFILSESDNKNLALFLDILKLNDQIPMVSTDVDFVVIESRNVEGGILKPGTKLNKNGNPEFFKYPPVEINFLGKRNYLFYKDSKIYQELTDIILKSSDQFIEEIRNNSSLLPTILVNGKGELIQHGNIPPKIKSDSIEFKKFVSKMIQSGTPIAIDIDQNNKKYLYYKNSSISSYIRWFPIALYATLAILIFIAYRAIKNARNFEKNQIWVGMSKETAHQLGTPISSLSAWLEVLDDSKNLNDHQKNMVVEMRHDVNRLSLIADRFSKIGSKPKLEQVLVDDFIKQCIDYLQYRASNKIHFSLDLNSAQKNVRGNKQLFEWVIENVVKNAVDAIGEEGTITIKTSSDKEKTIIDILDTGKGIHSSEFDKIFEPGYTTKKRGWGLGLSLCKRIVEEYFEGRIFVKNSKLRFGTTIRIILDTK